MVTNLISENRRNGIYYTPTPLAEFLAKPLINRANLSVFDPAYGEGALLLAAEKAFKEQVDSDLDNIALWGCDKSPVNGFLGHLPSSNLFELDFFEYTLENKFDVILMNPPYIRHHLMGKDKIRKYQDLVSDKCKLNYTTDLWGYFLVKSIGHLKKNGSIGAILPWSFLQAEYAYKLRAWLLEIFREIKVLALSAKYFDNAKERVLLIWLKNHGEPCRSIEIASTKNVDDKVKYVDLPVEKWKSDKVLLNENHDVELILSRYVNEFGFSNFGTYANVKIGVVTGADDYFIVTQSDAKEIGFTAEDLIPIFTTSKEFPGLVYNGHEDQLKRLVVMSDNKYEYFKDYIKKEKRNNIIFALIHFDESLGM